MELSIEDSRSANDGISSNTVANTTLLNFHIRAPQIVLLFEHMLNLWLNFAEQIDELDIGGQEETSGLWRAQVVLGMKQLELYKWRGAWIAGDQIAKLAQNVSANFYHVFVASGRLQRLEHRFGRIALHIGPIDHYLNDPVPDLFAHVVPGDPDQVEHNVHVPRVVHGILFGQYGHFEHHFFPDVVVGRFQVGQHFLDYLLGVGAIAHGVQQVHSPLSHADVALCLQRVYHCFLVLFDSFVRKFRRGQQTHGLEGQVAEIGVLVGQKVAQLVARLDQQVGLGVYVDDEVDGLEENGVFGVRMLQLF
ncbi:hypothetical protein BpHYR1_013335 [Brachionus plicatilis]|uniref:Uncharacterized protein n=1 Tax=Brachionus plicatilis TaxID=10195 RepID=A0A3M7QWA8_BRAPC|nr:hypothetical protein BpHYR1_013335 [Brachionus plicatilis]